jgi:hypothetical protein
MSVQILARLDFLISQVVQISISIFCQKTINEHTNQIRQKSQVVLQITTIIHLLQRISLLHRIFLLHRIITKILAE